MSEKTAGQACYEAKQPVWTEKTPWPMLPNEDKQFWELAAQAAINHVRQKAETVLRKTLACITAEEWCDYWREGNNTYLADKLTTEEMRKDFAESSKRMVELICVIRGWDFEVVKDLTFSEANQSISEHMNAMYQAMRD